MKRRLLIAKALSHEPSVLFLDEPTAGVDVELRQGMWETVEYLRQTGVTVIPHHALHRGSRADGRPHRRHQPGRNHPGGKQAQADEKLGQKQLVLQLREPLSQVPAGLAAYSLTLGENGESLVYTYQTQSAQTGIDSLLKDLGEAGIRFTDLHTTQSSLEDIFLDLVNG